jgi:transcriptional regulator with XRE-family HTH domain
LSELRRARLLSQEAAAERVGVSTKQIGRLERGEANVTLATLVACATTYRVELAELFTRNES